MASELYTRPKSVEEFEARLRRSGLISEEDINEAVEVSFPFPVCSCRLECCALNYSFCFDPLTISCLSTYPPTVCS